MRRTLKFFIWPVLVLVIGGALWFAATSPLLQWRQPVYIAAGFAGVVGLALMLVQPMLAARALPGVQAATSRRWHRRTGGAIVRAVVVHVAGLWITSPPDVIDALTFTSATPFSAWGVIGMWGLFAAAGLAAYRRRLRFSPKVWKWVHKGLASGVILCTILHVIPIDGTMEPVTKMVLLICLTTATAWALQRA